MRNFPTTFVSALNDRSISLRYCLHMEADGNIIAAWNSSDVDLVITPSSPYMVFSGSTITYAANPGIEFSDFASLAENARSSVDISTIATSAMMFSMFRNESETIWFCEYFAYEENTNTTIPIMRGFVSDISLRGVQMNFEIRNMTDFLSRINIGKTYSTADRKSLKAHGVEENWKLQGITNGVISGAERITFSASANSITFSATSTSFAFGKVYFLSGPLNGMTRSISSSNYDTNNNRWIFSMFFPTPIPVPDGTSVKIIAGYDRTWTRAKFFGLQRKFDGEPFIPRRQAVINTGV